MIEKERARIPKLKSWKIGEVWSFNLASGEIGRERERERENSPLSLTVPSRNRKPKYKRTNKEKKVV